MPINFVQMVGGHASKLSIVIMPRNLIYPRINFFKEISNDFVVFFDFRMSGIQRCYHTENSC